MPPTVGSGVAGREGREGELLLLLLLELRGFRRALDRVGRKEGEKLAVRRVMLFFNVST